MEIELNRSPGSTPTGTARIAQGESTMCSHGFRMVATIRM